MSVFMLWPFLLVFLSSLVVYALLAIQVQGFLAEYGADHLLTVEQQRAHGWMFALATTLLWVLPVSGSVELEQLTTFTLMLFLFRAVLTDAVSGWLPLRFTLSCLIAGLIVTAAASIRELLEHLLVAGCIWFGGIAFRHVGMRVADREVLGLGDVWLSTALAAWLGSDALEAMLLALTGFLVWHYIGYLYCNSNQSRVHEGPLGPWLCYSVLVMLIVVRLRW